MQQIAFIILSIVAIFFFVRNVKKLRRNILMGKPIGPVDRKNERWRLLVLNALGQRKMFKRPIPAILHFFVYAGFIIINIEILEIVLDGVLNKHRLFAGMLGGYYAWFIDFFEFLAVATIIACAIFLIRRNILKLRRFQNIELRGWPRLDANIILFTEIMLMIFFLTLNATDQVLETKYGYENAGTFFFSSFLTPIFSGMNKHSLYMVERVGWWGHIIGIFAFLNYLPISKHLHILLSFPNTWYSKLDPMGEMKNMPEIQKEVQLMLNPDAASTEPPAEPERFGAKDVADLNWRDLLGAYSCTECGRCTAVCPANQTGKLLSPRKIMMDTRDRCEEIGRGVDKAGKDFKDEKSLLGDYIKHEEIMACNTCQACVEACPVNIDPLSIIVQLRRYIIMEEAKSPGEWNVMFGNIENNQAPWQFSPGDRFKWAEEMKGEEA